MKKSTSMFFCFAATDLNVRKFKQKFKQELILYFQQYMSK